MAEFNRIMVEHDQTQVAAPRPVDELTTERVLVMERFFGHRVDDVEKLRAANVDGEATLLVGMRAWFQCMIFHGFFHGDVHAGNLMALADGRIGFLDFGIVGRFARERREQVTDYLMAFATGDFRKLAEVMTRWASFGAGVDIDALAKDLAEAYRPHARERRGHQVRGLIPAIMRTAVQARAPDAARLRPGHQADALLRSLREAPRAEPQRLPRPSHRRGARQRHDAGAHAGGVELSRARRLRLAGPGLRSLGRVPAPVGWPLRRSKSKVQAPRRTAHRSSGSWSRSTSPGRRATRSCSRCGSRACGARLSFSSMRRERR